MPWADSKKEARAALIWVDTPSEAHNRTPAGNLGRPATRSGATGPFDLQLDGFQLVCQHLHHLVDLELGFIAFLSAALRAAEKAAPIMKNQRERAVTGKGVEYSAVVGWFGLPMRLFSGDKDGSYRVQEGLSNVLLGMKLFYVGCLDALPATT